MSRQQIRAPITGLQRAFSVDAILRFAPHGSYHPLTFQQEHAEIEDRAIATAPNVCW